MENDGCEPGEKKEHRGVFESVKKSVSDLFHTPKQLADRARDIQERQRRKAQGIDEPTDMEREELEREKDSEAIRVALYEAQERRKAANEYAKALCVENYAKMIACMRKANAFTTCYEEKTSYWECNADAMDKYLAKKDSAAESA
eukprot:CFRG2448T1